MKGLVYTGPEGLDYREVADATPRDGEELIRIGAVGICGSDMHAYLGHDERRPAPLILGHEAAGVIEGGPRAGTRVTINPLVTCGTCSYCRAGRDNVCQSRQIISMPPREGAFAEAVAMPPGNLVEVPDHVPLAKAALAEPLACGWHAARLARAVRDGGPALVIGGGAIGLGAALALKARGIEDVTIIEPNAERRAFLIEACGQVAVDNDGLAPDALFEIVIDGVGFAATRATACARARPGGVIAHIGLGASEGGFDARRLTLQEITFIGTYTYTMQDFRDTAAAIFDGRLGPLDWTEARPLADGARAFADIRAGRVPQPKIVLIPENGPPA